MVPIATLNKNPRPGVLQNIASAVSAPGNGNGATSSSLDGGVDTTQNLRSAHWNECGAPLNSLCLMYPGWYQDPTSEVIAPNAYTVTASIEYPSGTFTQVTWGSSSSASISPGTNVLSDVIFLPQPIPAATKFWVRTFVSVTGGQIWPVSNALDTNNDLGEAGIGLADKTMGGTISGSKQTLRPCGILGYAPGMKKISQAGVGDSIMWGSNAGGADTHGNYGFAGRAATGKYPYISVSVVGTTLANQVIANKFQYRLDMLKKSGVTQIICDWGVNDTTNLATTEANLQTMWGMLSAVGAKLYHTTLGPNASFNFFGVSNANYVFTVACQTAVARYNGAGAVGNQTTAYIKGTPVPLNGFINNVDILTSSADSGIWATGDSNPSSDLLPSDNWTVTASPTTTSFVSDSTKPSSYYQFGAIEFTSGALSGTAILTGLNNTSGTFSYSSTTAPSIGDTFKAYPAAIATTPDGLHPQLLGNNGIPGSASSFGGVALLRDNLITYNTPLNV